jgi:hypothetical protein
MDVTVEALKLMGSLCRINQTFLKATIETWWLVETWSIWLFV